MRRLGRRRCRRSGSYNDETTVGPIRGAALPMGFNRQPHYADGLLLVGDAGGMVNPFNGEGIAYAMESGRLGARRSSRRPSRDPTTPAVNGSFRHTPGHEGCPRRLLHPRAAGSPDAIGNPEVMRLATKYGLPRTTLMRFLLKIMANLPEQHGGRADDRIIQALSTMAPDA